MDPSRQRRLAYKLQIGTDNEKNERINGRTKYRVEHQIQTGPSLYHITRSNNHRLDQYKTINEEMEEPKK